MKSNGISLLEIQKIFPKSSVRKILSSLIEKGYIEINHHLQDPFKPKYETYVFLHHQYKEDHLLKKLMEELERAPRQLQLFLSFLHIQQTEKSVPRKKLLEVANAQTAQLRALIAKGVFREEKLLADRVHLEEVKENIEIRLSSEQEEACSEISIYFREKKPVLLWGITGSGKTHIYFHLIEKFLMEGKQILYLLPEIALTAQIIRRLQKQFGNSIGIYHSRFGHQERVEIWKKVFNGECKVVIGARSSLLLPFKNLGLIIVDEEHDSSYKQNQPAPRYQARDTALYMARKWNINIILGSATPSLESWQNKQEDKLALVRLNKRFGAAKLPDIHLIDLKKANEDRKMRGIFSFELLNEIKTSLQQRKQVLLFQNRRGYSPFLICYTCGWIPHCDQCDVSLTYHKYTDKLHCHYCGKVYNYPVVCRDCGHNQVQIKSYGTERIEEDIKKEFPNARIARFDWDVLKTKNRYKDILLQFENRQIDILVGTQMLVKGLDFEHVNLVGVLSADALLSYPDFRVNERVFQLLEQVSGRAGRQDDQGKVLIQTYKPDHPVIQYVQKHQSEDFLQWENQIRKEFIYPPWCRFLKITLRHKNLPTLEKASGQLAEQFNNLRSLHVIGPATPPVSRIRNKYLHEIILKLPKYSGELQKLKREIRHICSVLNSSKNFSALDIIIDVDA